jgi:hypothetical protein
LVEQESCINSVEMRKEVINFYSFVWLQSVLTLISSFKLLPLKSKYVSELEQLGFNVKEWAIWLTPFAVKPQFASDNLHRPLEILAIGPAK